MSGPIAALLRSLRLAGLDIDAEAVLDSMWLGTRILAAERVRADAAATPADSSATESRPGGTAARESDRRSSGSFRSDSIVMRTAEFATPTSETSIMQQGGASALARSITLERAAALPASRELIRSLRPLRRRVVSPGGGIVDLEATVRRAAEEDLWFPTFAPARERWLDVLLVVDHGVSMIVWKDTVDELERVLRTSGAFRSVRSWWLETGVERIAVTARGRGASPSTPEALSRLTRGASRSVVLLVSDCVGARWHDGVIPRLVDVWSRALPVGLLQVTPEWFWARTALGDTVSSRFRSGMPAATNRRFRWDATEFGGAGGVGEESAALLRVPAATLTSEALARLAGLIAGIGREWAPGVVFDLTWSGTDDPDAATPLTGAERVARFRALASKSAQRLAAGFAASPVRTLGVLRLLRRDLLPDATPFVEAEVLLGGIVRVKREDASWDLGASLPLELAPGVQPLLLDGAVAGDVLRVLAHAARVAASGIGETFTSWLEDPSSGEGQLDPAASAFAAQAAAALSRLGGPYARIIKSAVPGSGASVETEATGSERRAEPRTSGDETNIVGETHRLVRARRLYGREQELKRIEEWLETESRNRLGFVGESGMGKSALAAEALASWRKRHPNAPTPFVWSFRENPSPQEALQAMHRHFGGEEAYHPEPAEQRAEPLVARLAAHGPAFIALDDVGSIPEEDEMVALVRVAREIARLPEKRVTLVVPESIAKLGSVEVVYVARLASDDAAEMAADLFDEGATPEEMDWAIVFHLRLRHNVTIGESTAAQVRATLGRDAPANAAVEVKGRDIQSGEPRTVQLTAHDISEAVRLSNPQVSRWDAIQLARDLGDGNPFVIQRLVAEARTMSPDDIREELIPDWATTGDEALHITAARAVEMRDLLQRAAVARDLARSGRDRFRERDLLGAAAEFSQVVEMRSSLPSRRLRAIASLDLSRVELALNDHARAAQRLSEVLRADRDTLTDPEKISVMQTLATALFDQGEADGALRLLREAIDIAPSTRDSAVMVELLQELAQMAETTGRYDDARDALTRLKAIRGDLAPSVDAKLALLERLRIEAQQRASADDAAPVRAVFIVRGRVSGVGYRQFAEQEARRLEISGVVQNLPDGTIRVEALGSRRTLEAYRDRLREGPRGAVVTDVSMEILTARLRRAVIAVGVSRPTSTLPVLEPAIDAARRIADWAQSSQRIPSHHIALLTDEKEPVNARRISDAAKLHVETGIDQLIVYLAGYTSVVNRSEYYRAAAVPGDPVGAIDIEETRTAAREWGVPHVVLITDTCRLSSFPWPTVNGIPLYPPRSTSPGVVDSFASARIGNSDARPVDASEAIDEERAARYRALYTDALLRALGGSETSTQVERDGVRYVSPHAVAEYLFKAMPRRLREAGLPIEGPPEARIESEPDAWLARFDEPIRSA